MRIAIFFIILAGISGCTTSKTAKATEVAHTQIDSTLIMDRFYIDQFYENKERNSWEYTTSDGTEVRASDVRSYHYNSGYSFSLRLTPPYDYYRLVQLYDGKGDIISRGKLSWRNAGGGTKIGEWEYYDENGVKTIVNEETNGKVTYEDVISRMESKGILDRETGKSREEDLDIYFSPEKDCWVVRIVFEERRHHRIHIHKDSGRILRNEKGPFVIIR